MILTVSRPGDQIFVFSLISLHFKIKPVSCFGSCLSRRASTDKLAVLVCRLDPLSPCSPSFPLSFAVFGQSLSMRLSSTDEPPP